MRAENRMAAPVVTQAQSTQNVVQVLVERAQKNASQVGARQKKGGRWEDVTWGKILEDVKVLSAGLVAQGVRPGDRVSIFAGTSLQWVICDWAIKAAQAITVPLYFSNTPDECRYILNHAESMLILVDNDQNDGKQAGRLSRIRQKLAEIPSVKKVVIFEGAASGEREMMLSDLIAQGEAAHRAHPQAFEERVQQVKAEDTAFIIYTSGTTGAPKGVMLSHECFKYQAQVLRDLGMITEKDVLLHWLPLAHVFSQSVVAGWIGAGSEMAFAEAVDKLLPNLAETHPTVKASIPRVYEKVYGGVIEKGSSAPGLKGQLFRWAMGLFDEYAEAKKHGREYSSLQFALAKRLVFKKLQKTLQERLGGRMRLLVSGGAPLSPKIAYFFELVGAPVYEGFGLTEVAGAVTVNRSSKNKIGTVGPPFPGTEIRIAPDGEVLIRGPSVMKGYYKNPEATREVLDSDGWFHTGDIGELDADNYLRITDRKKDIIVTAGGKNVAPQNIENQLKTFPLISQALVYGDNRPYLVLLVTLNEDAARSFLQSKGITPGTYAEMSRHPEIRAAVQAIINKVNQDLPPYSTLKRFALLEADFSQEAGEITPSLKVKRKICNQKYKAIIESLYSSTTAE